MSPSDPTLTPDIIVSSYERAYRQVYGHDPRIRHVGGQWYYVGDETVHRITLLAEIKRLRSLAQVQQPPPSPSSTYAAPNRSMIQRLIARLRAV